MLYSLEDQQLITEMRSHLEKWVPVSELHVSHLEVQLIVSMWREGMASVGDGGVSVKVASNLFKFLQLFVLIQCLFFDGQCGYVI